jgi:hypothetical protein
LGSFADFKAKVADESQMSPEDKAALAVMRQRTEGRTERADKMQNNVMNQSFLQGFLAMMGGRTLAEGVALAASKFGSTYATADQAAQAAKEKAEDAKDAHAQYEMALKRGDKKLAADMLEKYEKIAADRDKASLEHTAKMAQVGATNAGTLATKQYTALTSANNALTTAVAKRDAEKTAVEKSMQKSYDAQYIMIPDKDKPTFTENFNKALRRRLLEIDKAHASYIDPLEDDAAYIRGIVQNKNTAASTNNIKPLGPKS